MASKASHGRPAGTELFTAEWEFRKDPDGTYTAVRLPHDAMMWEGRSAESPSGAHQAHFLGGCYRYRTTWSPTGDLQGKQVSLVFEGVYRHSRVLVNGRDVGGAVRGYTEFVVRIDPELRFGEDNLIEVTVENDDLPGERWYTGSGIYRPVWLRVQDDLHLERDGVRFRTLAIEESFARAEVTVLIANLADAEVQVEVQLTHDRTTAASGSVVTSGAFASVPLTVADPLLWSAEHPSLYECHVQVRTGDDRRVLDDRSFMVGLRTVEVAGRRGLLVNGVPTKLRGGNIHHDNGVLGAATFAAAERRRVAIMREQGFNALRSAHNPMSRAMLEACDELGMYVMDELCDGWYDHKTGQDDALTFTETWPIDVEAMVAKDRNHPCVLMYSVGNENTEPATAFGLETARRLVEHVRALDPDRLVTMGVNVGGAVGWPAKRKGDPTVKPISKSAVNMDSTMINLVINYFGGVSKVMPKLARVDRGTRDLFEMLDVAGYNYGAVRYPIDARLHPDRVIIGTETFPGDVADNWAMVEELPTLAGDFIWSGWDYLGEAGIGTWTYGRRRDRFHKPYPQLVAGCGAIDITGEPGAPMFHAQAAWGVLEAPVIAVRPLDVSHLRVARTAWRNSDAVASWAWHGREGATAHVEIYSTDDQVEVLLNGTSLGRKPAGPGNGCLTRFETVYAPGEIVAVGYRDGVETGRSVLRSAATTTLHLRPESTRLLADGQDLAFVHVELADDTGVVECLRDELVTVTVEGPGTLAGFGSAAPATTRSYLDHQHRTYRGRALAVVRAGTTPGEVTVTATSRAHGSTSIAVEVTG